MFARFRRWVKAILDEQDREAAARAARAAGRPVLLCGICHRRLLADERETGYCTACWQIDGEPRPLGLPR